jgi:Amt family ammonium transporter
MVQPKNYLHTVMQSFSICCLITCVWMIFGYSLAFRPGTAVIGGASRFWLLGMEVWSIHPLAGSIPESVFMVRQRAQRAHAHPCIPHSYCPTCVVPRLHRHFPFIS